MQVYVLLHDGANILIVQKRLTNDWWQHQVGKEVFVNQGGQWALPGGGVDQKEDPHDAAMRELYEETGLKLNDTWTVAKSWFVKTKAYAVLSVKVDAAILKVCAATINIHLSHKFVKDLELAGAQIVAARDVAGYLGKQVALNLSSAQQTLYYEALARNKWSQSIDWYGEIAKAIVTQGLP